MSLTCWHCKILTSIRTEDKPVIFAYHGYPYLIHRLTYRRTNHGNIHVRGFMEEGTTTTPFDMTVMNQLDRYHLALEAIARVPGLAAKVPDVTEKLKAKLAEHAGFIRESGEDMPEITGWRWRRA
jgi:xylulose-5-phosphate/fructose-6-phosphate phosphoketolase